MRCYRCLSEDGKIETYANEEAGITEGQYHEKCALEVGFNEWDVVE